MLICLRKKSIIKDNNMRKKILSIAMMCLAAMTASAQTARQSSDSLYIQKSYSQEQMLMPVNPTYIKNVSEAANWGRNWFIEAKGGASALPHFKPHIAHS